MTDKRIDEHLRRRKGGGTISEYDYIVGYRYTYDRSYEGEFFLEDKDVFDAIEPGMNIPVRVLKIKPEVSFPMRTKLAKHLGFPKSRCN